MTLKEIIRKANLSTRPEYYSGRGAYIGDLNSNQLEEIYKDIKKEFGKQAATNYAQMVADTDKLSATLFLNNLYRLESNDWKNWESKQSDATDHIDFGISTEERLVGGMCALFGDNQRDDTPRIVGKFLHEHCDEINIPEKPMIFIDGCGKKYTR